MADSTLDMTGEETPVTTLGHGTGALGPSDSSDSGSDVMGGPGMDEGLTDDQSREMPETIHASAGRDLGDVTLSSDSDRAGTGVRGGSGVDNATPNDQALPVRSENELTEGLSDDDLAQAASGDDAAAADAAAMTATADADLDNVPVDDGAT